MRKPALLLTLVVIVVTLVNVSACHQEKVPMKTIIAGSLMVPFHVVEEEFERQHPNVDVLIEGHGSIQVIRHVTELHAEADVVVVADYSLIPMMMYDVRVPGTTENYADWYLKFATNSIGLAYTNQSKYADQINSTNWYEILSKPDVRVGISDPRFDSCGYRALMVCQLAELYYDDDTILERVIGGFTPPITVNEDNGVYVISVPEILEPLKAILRGSSVRLLSILESGDLDYAFMYQSLSEQYKLDFLKLPAEIALGSDSHKKLARELKVKLAFQRFASVMPEFTCHPIQYGITIPQNAPHPELAVDFLSFALGPEGQSILWDNHQPSMFPARTDNLERLPDGLKQVAKQEGNT